MKYIKQDQTCVWCGREFTHKMIYGMDSIFLPICSVNCLKWFLKITEPATLPDYDSCFLYKPGKEKNFRSLAETRFFNWMKLNGMEVWYEPFIFDIYVEEQDNTKKLMYIPDFYLPKHKIFIEIKNNEFSQRALRNISAFNAIGFCIYVLDLSIYRMYPSLVFKKGFVK